MSSSSFSAREIPIRAITIMVTVATTAITPKTTSLTKLAIGRVVLSLMKSTQRSIAATVFFAHFGSVKGLEITLSD